MTILANGKEEMMWQERNFMSVHMLQHPFIFSDKAGYRIRRHVVFWLFWWLFQAFLYSFLAVANDDSYADQLGVAMMESFVFIINHIFLAYSLIYFVIPRYLLKQRYWMTAGLIIVLFFLTACISSFLALFVLPDLRYFFFHIHSGNYRGQPKDFFFGLLAGLRGGITIGGIAAAIKLMKYWYIKEQRNLQLQKENAEAQLQLLKAQVHPHFLFNTLNNIYSYSQKTSPVAAGMVTGLSDLLRFMLYEGNQPLVPLSKEIKMIKDYINLETIRYGNQLELHLDLPEHTDDLHIAPLLLLPLVENCFKHGTSNIIEQPWIHMHINIHQKQLRMKLINGKTNMPPENNQHAGIGVINTQKRLSLLYPGKHEILITNDEEVFIVNLKIELEIKKEIILKPIQQEAVHA